jgi:Zn-dependent protease with chaperone function
MVSDPQPAPDSREPARPVWDELVAELKTPVRKVRSSFAYRLSQLMVAVAMVMLPIMYLCMIAVVVLLVVAHARGNTGIIMIGPHHPRAILLGLALYLAPIIGGAITVFFMVKPLLARAGRRPASVKLDPRQQTGLFQVVRQLARTMGTPEPAAIEVTCEPNASARFRRGWLSLLLPGDLVLVIGLPLVGALSARQLLSVLAHELGHFTQGGGMRLSYLIISLNDWFDRVARQRDHWDDWLDESGRGDVNIVVKLGLAVTRGMVWLCRQVLVALLHMGHLVSFAMMRQMERDADRRAARVAGADPAASLEVRLFELGFAGTTAISSVYEGMDKRQLPEDLPGLICRLAATLPLEARKGIQARTLEVRTHPFDSHPSPRERIAALRRDNEPGIVRCNAPATDLLEDFPRLCKRVTRFEYEHHFGLDVRELAFVPLEPARTETGKPAKEAGPTGRFFGFEPFPLLGPRLTLDMLASQDPAPTVRQRMLDSRAAMQRQTRAASLAYQSVAGAADRYLTRVAASVMVEAGFTLDGPSFGLSRTDRTSVEDAVRKTEASLAEGLKALEEPRRLATVRLAAAILLLGNPHVAGRLEKAAELQAGVTRAIPVALALDELWARWLELMSHASRLEQLQAHLERTTAGGAAVASHRIEVIQQRWTGEAVASLEKLRQTVLALETPTGQSAAGHRLADTLVAKDTHAGDVPGTLTATSDGALALAKHVGSALDVLFDAALKVEALFDAASETTAPRSS